MNAPNSQRTKTPKTSLLNRTSKQSQVKEKNSQETVHNTQQLQSSVSEVISSTMNIEEDFSKINPKETIQEILKLKESKRGFMDKLEELENTLISY